LTSFETSIKSVGVGGGDDVKLVVINDNCGGGGDDVKLVEINDDVDGGGDDVKLVNDDAGELHVLITCPEFCTRG